MAKTYIQNEYFAWLMTLIEEDYPVEIHKYETYLSLLNKLNSIEFKWTIRLDENRAQDGLALRYLFASESGYSEFDCEKELTGGCTVLEMMIALSRRCETEIMYNPKEGDRTEVWFWSMIESLGLEKMDCIGYDERKVDEIMQDFMDHNYTTDGKGSLFYIPNFPRNLKNAEIWYQMQWFLGRFYANF